MSIIVGVYDPTTGKSILATDSIGVNGYSKHTNSVKGALINGLAWGFTGEAAQSQRAVRWLQQCPTEEISTLLLHLHDYLLLTGTTAKDDKPATSLLDALVATPTGIYHLCSGGSIHRHDYFAIGAGDDFARGALFTLYGKEDINTAAQQAVKAACAMSIYCEGPVQIFQARAVCDLCGCELSHKRKCPKYKKSDLVKSFESPKPPIG